MALSEETAVLSSDFLKNVDGRRKDVGLTHAMLADKLSLSEPRISTLLSKPSNLQLDTICRLADAVKCKVLPLMLASIGGTGGVLVKDDGQGLAPALLAGVITLAQRNNVPFWRLGDRVCVPQKQIEAMLSKDDDTLTADDMKKLARAVGGRIVLQIVFDRPQDC